MLYFFLFIWSSISAGVANKFKTQSMAFWIFSLISLMPLLLIGGFRDLTVGSDTMAYPISSIQLINENNQISALTIANVEILYLALAYISVIWFGGDIQTMLFITNAIIILTFYWGFVRVRKYTPLGITMFIFLFLFYNMMLSMQRQGIAMGLVFLAYTFIFRRQLIPFFVLIFIAILFHKSAIASLLTVPCLFSKKTKYNKYIIFASFFLLIAYNLILQHFTVFNFFAKYESYSSKGEFSEGGFSNSEFILRLIFLIYIYTYSSKELKKKSLFKNITALLISEFFLNLLQIHSQFMGRLGYYIYTLYIIFLPYFIHYNKKKKKSYFPIVSVSVLIIFYWWFVYIYNNSGETYPYTSKILGL